MKENKIHTPEGVRDIYSDECKRKRVVIEKLHHVFKLYNYDEIETPTFEFFDIFNGEKGTASSNEMYKFVDRENNTLVLRPDMTPSIARCVSKYFSGEKHHIRLCYQGQTFLNCSRLQGKLSETTHMGAELIGDDTSAADGEIVSMMIDCFLAAGLSDFQVSIGQVEYFRGLVEEAAVEEEVADELREAIQNKNAFSVETICKQAGVSKTLTESFCNLINTYGDIKVLEDAKQAITNERCIKAIERLEKLYRIISYYGYEKYVSFDLGLLSDYNYYSGVIFRGYTYGTGHAVATGGRYNGLVKQFGVDTPSVGFAFIVDELVTAMNRQKINLDIRKKASMILYMEDMQKEAIAIAKCYRDKDRTAQLTRKSSRSTIEEYEAHCRIHDIGELIYLGNDASDILVKDVLNQTEKRVTIDDLKGEL